MTVSAIDHDSSS